MKTLTLTQPWATLVAIGAKRVETRSWATGYTGPLAIHAAKGFPKWAKETCLEDEFLEALGWKDPASDFDLRQNIKELPTGAVIAIVTLMGCRRTEDIARQLSEREREFGDYSEGRFAWMLSDNKPLPTPIPAKGALGLWDWEPRNV